MSEYTVVQIGPRSRLRTSPMEDKEVTAPTIKDLSFESAYELAKKNLIALKNLRGESASLVDAPKPTTKSKPMSMVANSQTLPPAEVFILTKDAEPILALISGKSVSSTFSDAQVAQALADYMYRLSYFDSKTALAKHHKTSTRSLDRWLAHYQKLQDASAEVEAEPKATFEEPSAPLGVLGDILTAKLSVSPSEASPETPAKGSASPPPVVEKDQPSVVQVRPAKQETPDQALEEALVAEMLIDIRQPEEILNRKDTPRMIWDNLTETQQKCLALAHKTRAAYSGAKLPKGILDDYGLVQPAFRPFVEELAVLYIDSATLKVKGDSFELLTSLTDHTQLSAEEVLKRALRTLAQAYGL